MSILDYWHLMGVFMLLMLVVIVGAAHENTDKLQHLPEAKDGRCE